ncbi:hypothetical protein C8C83_3241 [Flavobacterium sp. 90]|uniref:hypothetical protein n=1 Tax=unclassified Flavobacterium TaxID=196869 RepID=UPI000EACEC99|nr:MULTISPECIES: hypothetical protein [unclassified Flavobacterium]RKR11505.1 hypothetical protein C8C82_3551 [Flavobacterium sp. 81]TCK55287.1 hypothetical protein C8C83_3241 [Flavobacterium sp. 90]
MKKQIIILLLFSFSVFAQEANNSKTEKIDIESGAIIKQYNIDNKLESFSVEVSAAYYGNIYFFTKEKDTIIIKNEIEKDAVIKIYVKNQKKVSEFFYKGNLISSIEFFDFKISNLPSNSLIYSKISDNKNFSYLYNNYFDKFPEGDYEKSYKLYVFLKTSENNVNIDLLFNEIADFFSQEDALLRIYLSKYREKIKSESGENVTAYLKTDQLGKIKNGILWTKKSPNNGQYEIYSDGKIIKSENIELTSFQKVLNTYLINKTEFLMN